VKTWQLVILFFVIALLSGAAGFFLHQQAADKSNTDQVAVVDNEVITPEAVIGKKAPAIRLSDMQGEIRQLSDWQGKLLVVNFWATWCPPCREEIPLFVDTQAQYQEQGLQFLGVALHSADEIQDFMVEFQFNYPSLVGNSDVIALGEQLGNDIGALPYTVLIDRQGIIRFSHRGKLKKAELQELISRYL